MAVASEPHSELLEIADRLERWAQQAESPDVRESLTRLEEAAGAIGKAWSGSWLGYHARVYYQNLKPPPPEAHFSIEWGLKNSWPVRDTIGSWQEFDGKEVEKAIFRLANDPELKHGHDIARGATKAFENDKVKVLSLLSTVLAQREDGLLTQIKDQVGKTNMPSKTDFIQALQPSGKIESRDSLAVKQGIQTPPHISVLCHVSALRQLPAACAQLAQLARKAGSHLAGQNQPARRSSEISTDVSIGQRQNQPVRRSGETGTDVLIEPRQNRRVGRSGEIGANVLIGHGRSPIWRELGNFIQDRLHLRWDEFSRAPGAGLADIARLSELLDATAIAFLVMAGQDEQAEGKLRARMNVIHEAGLFQGRLGFTRAIVVLEEGCEGFSNIYGLGQIRFPKGNIKAAFDEVRQVLEREGLIDPV